MKCREGVKLMTSIRTLTLILLTTSTASLAQWTKVYHSEAYALAANSSELFVGGPNVYGSSNDGLFWDGPYLSDNSVSFLAAFDSVLFASTNTLGWGGLHRSKPRDTAWTYQAFGDQYFGNMASTGSVIILGPIMGGEACGLYRTSNNGLSWTSLPTDPPGCISDALATMGSSIYVGNWRGVTRSTNGGINWSFVNSGIGSQQVISFGVMGSTLFAGTVESGIFKLGTNLTTWTPINAGNDFQPVTDITVVGSNLYIVTDVGGGSGWESQVYFSTDSGGHWTADPLAPSRITSMLAFHEYLFVAGPSGVWRRPLSEFITSVISDARSNPDHYLLENNFPNPFNSGTTILYDLPSHGHTTLEIYDILGRKVATLVDGVASPGKNAIYFDASMLPGGVYYCRLTHEKHIEMQKLILSK